VASDVVILFVYGTLMDDALVFELTGRRFRTAPATLNGFRKVSPRLGYPYVVVDPGGVVNGLALYDVDAEALRRFDVYEDEGRLYRRVEVAVTVAEREERALTYVGMRTALRPF